MRRSKHLALKFDRISLRTGVQLFFISFILFSTFLLPYRQRQWFLLNATEYQNHHPTYDSLPMNQSSEKGGAVDEKRNVNTNRANETTTVVNEQDEHDAEDSVENVPKSNNLIPDLNETNEQIPNNNFMGIVARPFSSWPLNASFPCFQPNDRWKEMAIQFSPAYKGFFFLKPYKTGSSTTSGVHLRIARNVAQRRYQQNFDICNTRFDHGPDFHPGYTLFRQRIPEKSFLWTVLRDPTARAISEFFHMVVSRQKNEPTDQNFKQFLRQSSHISDYYYRALYPKDIFNRDVHKPIPAANHILRTYNFIGVTERMDESFVVLMMLLRLKIADILYLSAKTRGGYDDAGGKSVKTCTYIWPSFVSTGMKEYFSSKEWRERIRYDVFLYEAVNRSLDLTIDQLGRERFHAQLHIFQTAQQAAHERCLPHTKFPCDESGQFHDKNSTDCIWNDSGCGTTCLDKLATELNLW